jgi:4-aminobutyrate aminotransferase/(S)-3-amino-2-methylpropionate transaminase
VIGDVRGRGAMVAIELVRPGTREPAPAATLAAVRACHSEGLLVLTAGTFGNVIRFLPPLVAPQHLLVEGLDILDKALTDPLPSG